MKLVKCYRDGGAEAFITLSDDAYKDFRSEQDWLDLFNAMATDPADSNITMFQIALQTAPGVFEFRQ